MRILRLLPVLVAVAVVMALAIPSGNGDSLMVGPINCPDPGGLPDPFCGATEFSKAIKSIAKVPADGSFIGARLGPEPIPDPPFGQ